MRKQFTAWGLLGPASFDTARGMEATPLAVDGVLYTTIAWSKVYAFEAGTGRPLWSYDPKYRARWDSGRCDVVNRGAAFAQGKVYVGTLDGRLIALDAKTGKLAWSTLTVDQRDSSPAIVIADIRPKSVRDHGSEIFETTCSVCQGATARSSGVMPDPRRSGVLASKEAWRNVVIDGALKDRGMIGFGPWLNNDDSEAIRAYAAERARHLADQGN